MRSRRPFTCLVFLSAFAVLLASGGTGTSLALTPRGPHTYLLQMAAKVGGLHDVGAPPESRARTKTGGP